MKPKEASVTRRAMLQMAGCGFGSLGLAGTLQRQARADRWRSNSRTSRRRRSTSSSCS